MKSPPSFGGIEGDKPAIDAQRILDAPTRLPIEQGSRRKVMADEPAAASDKRAFIHVLEPPSL
jgi:hypothetical protein